MTELANALLLAIGPRDMKLWSISASSSSSRGGLLCGSAKFFNGVPLARGNVFPALNELPYMDRGGGPRGVVETLVRYDGGSWDGVVLFGLP